jgi:hypothetical protein
VVAAPDGHDDQEDHEGPEEVIFFGVKCMVDGCRIQGLQKKRAGARAAA